MRYLQHDRVRGDFDTEDWTLYLLKLAAAAGIPMKDCSELEFVQRTDAAKVLLRPADSVYRTMLNLPTVYTWLLQALSHTADRAGTASLLAKLKLALHRQQTQHRAKKNKFDD